MYEQDTLSQIRVYDSPSDALIAFGPESNEHGYRHVGDLLQGEPNWHARPTLGRGEAALRTLSLGSN